MSDSTALPSKRVHRWELFTDRKLRRLRRNQICNVLFLLEYAARYCVAGVLWDTDADIASGIGLEMEQFQSLIDLLMPRQIVRARLEMGVRWYEFSRDLEPLYDGDKRDFTDNWDRPTPKLTVPTAPSEPQGAPDDVHAERSASRQREFRFRAGEQSTGRKGNRKYEIIDLTQYEKNCYYKASRDAEDHGLRPTHRDVWIVEFRARRNGNMGESNPPNDEDSGVKVTGESNRDDHPIISIRDSSYERENTTNNRSLGGESNIESNPLKVTPESNFFKSNLVESNPPAEPLSSEALEVYRFLHHEQGIWEAQARAAAVWCDLETAHAYIHWGKSINKPSEPIGGLVAKWLTERAPIPPEIRAAYARKEQETQRTASVQQAVQHKAVETEAIQAQIDRYWADLAQHERMALFYQAANKLVGLPRHLWKEFLEKRKTYAAAEPAVPLDAALNRNLDEALRERLHLPLLDKYQLPPSRFVMPPEWDGLLPEPGELPQGLGIPDLTEEDM